jgi:anti-sigma-K factor RskA
MMGSAQTENAGYRQAYLAFCAIAFVALAIATTLKPRREERRAPLDVAA